MAKAKLYRLQKTDKNGNVLPEPWVVTAAGEQRRLAHGEETTLRADYIAALGDHVEATGKEIELDSELDVAAAPAASRPALPPRHAASE